MKRAIIIISALFFGISILMSQNIQRELQENTQNINNAAEAERIRIAAEQQREQQREQNYQNAIASAQQNFEAQQYAMALHYYHRAIEIRPENATYINVRIIEISNKIQEAEREQRYQQAIASAQMHYAQREFAQAKQSYQTALGIRPENAVEIAARISAITEEMNKPAELRIYRPRARGGMLGRVGDFISVRYDILFGNTVVGGNTTENWNTTVTVTSFGVQTLSATIGGRREELQIDIQPGGIYYVRAGHSSQTRETGRTTTNRRGETTQVTETLHTPTLQLEDSSAGAAEFNAIGARR
jgi:tetratricopeptide (TPR) repeat protein